MHLMDSVKFLTDCVTETGRLIPAGSNGSIRALEADGYRVLVAFQETDHRVSVEEAYVHPDLLTPNPVYGPDAPPYLTPIGAPHLR